MRIRPLAHPLLTLTLAMVWVLLANDFSWAALAFGLLVGFAIASITSAYWPGQVRVRRPAAMAAYCVIVLWDILVSNVQVAWLVLFRRGASLRSRFIVVPLELQSPEAIAVLAGTITMTPGTVSADLSADGRALLVHCLEAADADEAVAAIKDRYERRLMRIFQ